MNINRRGEEEGELRPVPQQRILRQLHGPRALSHPLPLANLGAMATKKFRGLRKGDGEATTAGDGGSLGRKEERKRRL